MSGNTTLRLILAAGVLLGMLVLLAILLSAAQFGLSLWQQLQSAPLWVQLPVAVAEIGQILNALAPPGK